MFSKAVRTTGAVLLLCGVVATASATDFHWVGGCGENTWYAICASNECVPGYLWQWSNWGEWLCHPYGFSFPGVSDDVYITGVARLDYANASIRNVFVAAGSELSIQNGGQLTCNGTTIQNAGELWLRYGGYGGKGHLVVSSGLVLLAGAGVVRSNDGIIEGGGTLYIDATHTIAGYNLNIPVALDNAGTIRAESGGPIHLLSAGKFNGGEMKAAGGVLEISTTVAQTPSAVILADGGSVRLYNGSAITGGVLNTANGGQIYADAHTSTLTDVTNAGWLAAGNGGRLVLQNSLTNDGYLNVYYGGYYGCGTLEFANDLTIAGTGEVHTTCATLMSNSGATATLGAGQNLHGNNTNIDVAVDNLGVVTAEAGIVALRNAPKINRNLLQAAPGGYLDISTAVTQLDGGRILADGGHVRLSTGSTITGGELNTINGGLVYAEAQTTAMHAVTNRGWFGAGNGGQLNITSDSIQNDGSITLYYGGYYGNGRLRLDADCTISGDGTLFLTNGHVFSNVGAGLSNGPGHTITGVGPINVTLTNLGVVAPGSGAGTLTVNATFTQTDTGTLLAGVLGPWNSDRLAVGGAATLDGTLRLVRAGGYVPLPGHQFVVLTAGAPLTSQFAAVVGPGRFSAAYNNNQVLVTVLNGPGDTDCDGDVDFDDINPFVLALSDPAAYQLLYPNCELGAADCNGDGVVDFDDINAFVALLSAS
jgi:hypothetical protein